MQETAARLPTVSLCQIFKIGKGLALCLAAKAKKKTTENTYMRHVNLAKPENNEVAILGLLVQSVKMSLVKASRHSQPDLKLMAWL